ncbi:MAG: PD-(D/E)XK nuclease family protein [Nanoarchaeota archaeon]
MKLYSYSKLSTFEQCQLKFKFKYIDYLEPDFEETIEGFLGKQVHKTLEWIYNNQEKNLELDDIIKYFIESWNMNFNSDIRIIKQLPTEHYFNKGIKFLINYFLKNFPFKDNTIATEKKIFINLDEENNYRLIGYIDRLVHHQNTNVFEIHDYKTGNIKSQEEINKDWQLALYSIAIRNSFENVKEVFLIWHFLEYNQEIKSRRTIEELENLKKRVIDLINKIESTTSFQANPGYLCNWCEFQNNCPAFKQKEKEIKEKLYY